MRVVVLVVVEVSGVVVVLVVVELSSVVVVLVVLVVDGAGAVVLLVVVVEAGETWSWSSVRRRTEPTSSSDTSARIGTGALSTPSKLTMSVSSRASFSTTPLVPLCAAFPVAKVRLRPGCSDRSRATPSS